METDTDIAVAKDPTQTAEVQIVVTGRNVEVPDHYREHVAEKLARLERYDGKLFSIDVELFHEPNPRQSHTCQRIELTCKSRGPVIRSEACASDFYTALDKAVAKLEARLRRAADRRRVHRGRRTPISVAAATAGLRSPLADSAGSNGAGPLSGDILGALPRQRTGDSPVGGLNGWSGHATPGDWESFEESLRAEYAHELDADGSAPGRVIRQKEHSAKPMTVDQALFEMELVGHDFYLFSDVDTGRASVVYRRKGYHYGVISLEG